MDEFLSKLYNYEYFGTYLMISIAVLVLLFIIILVFGKKDQKNREIEATKKLQQINTDNVGNVNAFAETSEPNKVEVEAPTTVNDPLNLTVPSAPEVPVMEPNLENDTIIVPTINNISSEVPTPEMPEVPQVNPIQDVVLNQVPVPPVMPAANVGVDSVSSEGETPSIIEAVKPVLEKEDEQPFNFSHVDLEPVTSVEPVAAEVPLDKEPQIEVPVFNFDDIVRETTPVMEPVSQPKEVFSSVYTPEKKNEKSEIEMPATKEEEEIELPTLKKDAEEIEKPILNDYNLNNLSGESYNINE